MHTISIQKLSFILFIFTNTQVYATNIRTLKDLQEKNVNVVDIFMGKYYDERADKKEKFSNQRLEAEGYFKKKKEYDKLTNKAKSIAYKNKANISLSPKEQEFLNNTRTLGVTLREIRQRVEQQVEQEYPYSGQKGLDHDRKKRKKEEEEELKTRREKSARDDAAFLEKLGALRKKGDAEVDALRKKGEAELDALRKSNAKERESSKKEFFNKEKRIKKRYEQRQKYFSDKWYRQRGEYLEIKAKHEKEAKAKRTKAIVLGLGTAGAIGISTFATGTIRNVATVKLFSTSITVAIDAIRIKNKKVPDNRKTIKELRQEAMEHYPSSDDEDDSDSDFRKKRKNTIIKKKRKLVASRTDFSSFVQSEAIPNDPISIVPFLGFIFFVYIIKEYSKLVEGLVEGLESIKDYISFNLLKNRKGTSKIVSH